jgi:hypothetical protein
MLILQNLGLSVTSNTDVYESVTKAWKAALSFMENIIAGVPQSVQSAAVLLALSAWHLYPDMAVLGSTTTNVKQNDHLICPGGIITLGLRKQIEGNELGISWSLPLSHLRYYGKPVQATRSISTSSSRISMEELLLVSVGCVTNGWSSHEESNSLCARLLLAIRNVVQEPVPLSPWLNLLGDIASKYLSYVGEAKVEADVLIAFGRRRCQSFLSTSRKSLPPAFNLCRPEVFVELLKGTEAKIRWLRERFEYLKEHRGKEGLDFTDGLISYTPTQSEYYSLVSTALFNDETHVHSKDPDVFLQTYPFDEVCEWASLFPVFKDDRGHFSHRRWLPGCPLAEIHHGKDLPLPQYHKITTCAAERSFDIELSTGEPCSLFVDEPSREKLEGEAAVWSRFESNSIIWPFSPQSNVPVRPVQGSFLPLSPLSPISVVTPSGYYPVLDSSSSYRPLHPRSVQFQLGSGLQTYKPSVGDRGAAHASQSKVFGAWNTFVGSIMPFISFAQEDDDLLTQEVERISEIYITEMRRINNTDRATKETENGAPKDNDSAQEWSCDISDFHCLNGWYLKADTSKSTERFTKVFGNMGSSIAIYMPSKRLSSRPEVDLIEFPNYPALADSEELQRKSAQFPNLAIHEIIEALESGQIDPTALAQYVVGGHSKFWSSDYQNHLKSLNALCSAATVYSNIPDATVDLSITGKPFHDYQWANDGQDELAHARSLSCIATLESGHLNIAPESLAGVMGISTGNSLYIAQFVWSDPHHPPHPSVIRRSIGNVGKPGMAFLISPPNPRMKDPGYESWRSVPHLNFDGKLEGNFRNTSMHLSFTGYELALDTGEHGNLDKEAYFLEAVVQAYESCSWVADLDILTALNGNDLIKQLPLKSMCSHSEDEAKDFSHFGLITSVDSWIELLDQPTNTCIVRAGKNWLARLAAVVIGVQNSKPVVVASQENMCWACVRGMDLNFSSTIIVC